MKSLKQIADETGITTGAIYKRFSSYGLSVEQLKGEKRGKTRVFDTSIERLIKLMFQPETAEKEFPQIESEQVEKLKAEIEKIQMVSDGLEVELKDIKAEHEKAEERAEKAEARAERAEAQNEILLRQIDKLTDAIRAAEAVQAAQAARISAPDEQKGGIFTRLFSRRKEKK